MKAPSADYSSLSQALSAKNNALQTSYSVKDASNWKSSYDIQQKSFQLSREALNMQKEQTNASGALNMVNGIVNLVDRSAGLYSAIEAAKQDEITQGLTRNSTEMSSQWENLVQLNGDYMTEITDPVTGGKTLTLSQKGQEAYSSLEAQYFPQDKEYGWGMDEKVDNMKENLRINCMSYAQSIALNNIKGEAENNYAYNYEYAKKVDLNSGDTEDVTVDDGTGEMRTIPLGKRMKMVIDGKAASAGWSQTRINNEYIKASQELISDRQSYLVDDLTTGFTNGTYVNNAEARTTVETAITAHLDMLSDPVEKRKAETAFKAAMTNGVNAYFDNLYNTITDTNVSPYSDMKEVYETDLNKGGQYYSLFFDEGGNPNPNIMPSTYTSIKKKYNSYITAAEATGGTIATDQVNSQFTAAKQKWKAGQYNAKEFGAEVENIMSVYDEKDADGKMIDWRVGSKASEAWEVYMKNLEDLLPGNILSDPEFSNQWEATWRTAFKADNIDYDELDSDTKSRAAEIKYDMSDKIMSYLLNHPSAIVDKGEFINALKNISSAYTKDWADFVSSKPNRITMWDSLTGGEVKNKFNSEMDRFVSMYSTDFEGDITSDGYYNRSESNLVTGVNDTVNDAVIALGNILNAEGAGIYDTRAAEIKFKMNDDGTLYKEDGKPVMESVIYNGLINGKKTDIVYDISSKSWNKSMATGEGVSDSIIEKQEREEAESTLAGSRQIETIDNFLEDNPSPQYDELISFLQDNCINEDELEATLTILYNRHKEGKLRPGEVLSGYEDYMKSVADSVASSKGWESRNWNVTTRAKNSEAEKRTSSHTSSSGTTHNTRTKRLLTRKQYEWAKIHPNPSGEDIIAYLESSDDIEAAASELNSLSAEGRVTLSTPARKAMNNYLKQNRMR